MGDLACLALGSNIRPEFYLPAAAAELGRYGCLVSVSRVWQSAPVDGSDRPDFLNAAVLLKTPLTAATLCWDVARSIEAGLGRVRDPDDAHAARTIDIDLALFDDEELVIEHRRIPDPQLLDRVFVAVPVAELRPGFLWPGTGRSLAQMASALRCRGDLRPRPDVRLDRPPTAIR